MTTDEDLKNEILKIHEQIDTLKKEIIVRLERIESTSKSKSATEDDAETEDNAEDDAEVAIDPYKKLTKYSYEALNQVKKDLVRALERGSKFDINEANNKTAKITETVNDVIKIIENTKKRDEERIEINNPLYPNKKLWRYLPAALRLKLHSRGTTKWLGFLLTGVGVIIFSRGIWDASEALFSIQGSLIIGATIIILMAWLERKKIFAAFGES